MIPAALILAGCSATHSVGDSTHAGMASAMPSASHDMPHSSDFDAADVMTAWLQSWGSPVMDQDEAMGMGHGMQGILSDTQLAELKAASGSEFDRLFATYLIAHHEGAIDMAKQVEDSANAEVAALAKNIIASQTVEIDQLKAFLAK